ncbi:MAG TPA: hypothetical protein VFF21_07910 [Flavobacteriaceae bacterium]|nr:hypothetical protein [Flavobacteriaceae bacterium]
MRKFIGLFFITITILSCGPKKQTIDASKESKGISLGKKEVTKFHSLGNGVADIYLKFYENNTFLLDLKSIPQPETKDKVIKIWEKGTYRVEGDWNVISFKNPQFAVESVFDESLSTPGDFQVVDKETVKINNKKDGIMIWGVFCAKE